MKGASSFLPSSSSSSPPPSPKRQLHRKKEKRRNFVERERGKEWRRKEGDRQNVCV